MRLFFLLILALFFLPHSLWANNRCEEALKKHRAGAQFLHQRNPELHNSPFVNQLIRQSVYPKLSASSSPIDKLSIWLEHMERTHFNHINHHELESHLVEKTVSKIKKYYFDRYLIKPHDVPEGYFEFQKRIAREQGDGGYAIADSARNEIIKHIIDEQRFSMEQWLDYLLSDETSMYPMWAKYWIFTGLVKLGSFDKEKGRFTKRTFSTVAPFPELNREALAYVMDAIVKKSNKASLDSIQDPIFIKLLEGADFRSLYTQALRRTIDQTLRLTTVKGQWIKYAQGPDYQPLFESLQGKNTGWCTAGESTARTHLMGGDFYVYYSHDQNGVATNPRIAIRMEGSRIREVRGIGPSQNLDVEIATTQILIDKLKEFGSEGERYQKAAQHMKRLTVLEAKLNSGEVQITEELRFLYEIDEPIISLGHGKDTRIAELISKRQIKEDLSLILNISQEQISTTREESQSGPIVYHYGDLDLSDLRSAEGLRLPQRVGGELRLNSLRSAEGLKLPQTVGGDLMLIGLQSAEALTLPLTVGGALWLNSLQSAEGLKLPQSVGGALWLGGLRSAEGLILPETVANILDLSRIRSARGLTLPQNVRGSLNLNGLRSAEGLTLPQIVGGTLRLGGLQSAKGLKLPQTVGGNLLLNSLQTIDDLTLPQILGGNVYIGN